MLLESITILFHTLALSLSLCIFFSHHRYLAHSNTLSELLSFSFCRYQNLPTEKPTDWTGPSTVYVRSRALYTFVSILVRVIVFVVFTVIGVLHFVDLR